MRETDQHFSEPQLAALARRGLPLTGQPWRFVRVAVPVEEMRKLDAAGMLITADPRLLQHAERTPMCPILARDDHSELIVLPDGQELWVQR